MSTLEKLKSTSSSKLFSWLRKLKSSIRDAGFTPLTEMEPLIRCGEEDEEEEQGESNVDVIMKTLKKDVKTILEESEHRAGPNLKRINFKLDTLDNNIREICSMRRVWMKHSCVSEEVLMDQKKNIVRLIEEIMDDVYVTWDNMKKPKRSGTERSVNGIVSVLGLLKREVCRMINVLIFSKSYYPCKDELFPGGKAKSFDGITFDEGNRITGIQKKTLRFETQVTTEINVFGSKSFPQYCPKVKDEERNEVKIIKKEICGYEEARQEKNCQISTNLICPSENPIEEKPLKSQIKEQKEAVISYMYNEKKNTRFQNILSLKKDMDDIFDSTSMNIINDTNTQACKKHDERIVKDVSTVTDELKTGESLYSSANSSESTSRRLFYSDIDSKIYRLSKKVECTEQILNDIQEIPFYLCSKELTNLKESESVPALTILRQKQGKTSNERSEVDIDQSGAWTRFTEETSDSDSDDSYHSCTLADNAFNVFTTFIPRRWSAESTIKPDFFSYKSSKLCELEKFMRQSRFEGTKQEFSNQTQKAAQTSSVDSSGTAGSFNTLAFVEEMPERDIHSLSPQVSLSVISGNGDFEERKFGNSSNVYQPPHANGHRNNKLYRIKKSCEMFPNPSYISDSEFSNVYLSLQQKKPSKVTEKSRVDLQLPKISECSLELKHLEKPRVIRLQKTRSNLIHNNAASS